MTREINGRITMRVSDDGTRCAAECPHRNTPTDTLCMAYRVNGSPTNIKRGRAPACISAEQAAASVPSWEGDETPGLRRALGIAKGCEDYLGGYTSDPALLEAFHHGMQTVGAVIRKILDGDADYQTRVVEAIGSASDDHLDGGARAQNASEALREARVRGLLEGHALAARERVIGDTEAGLLLAAIEAVRKGQR